MGNARRHGLPVIGLLPVLGLLLGLVAPIAGADWGKDINPGAGPRLIEETAPALVSVLQAPANARERSIERFIESHGIQGIEATKRFRNPELKPLFLALARHPSWKVRHRALFALEYYGGKDALELALGLIDDPQPRLREKAVITCIKLWDDRAAPPTVQARIDGEEDFHVRRCLDALRRRIQRKLPVERVYVEHLEKRPDGLLVTPFLSGMNTAPQVAPGYQGVAKARQGGGSTAKLPAASRWVYPTLGYGEEVVKGTSLQPFANLRSNGAVYHVGHDVGASMDGAGYYAPAEGIVKLIHSGSDMGTLIVTEHHLGDKNLVNAVFMHGGDTVFVEAGEHVACGQLLGHMGMGYSIENGGHFAHLHFGMYPGAFRVTHNYGYKAVKAGLADWYDPARFLAAWTKRTAPVVVEQRGLFGALARAATLLEQGAYGKAYSEAARVRAGGGAEAKRAAQLAILLEGAPERALARAQALRRDGYPGAALDQLQAFDARLGGIPGSAALGEAHKAWKGDRNFKSDLKAEKAFRAAEKRAQKLDAPEKRRALWEKVLATHGETALGERIREKLKSGP